MRAAVYNQLLRVVLPRRARGPCGAPLTQAWETEVPQGVGQARCRQGQRGGCEPGWRDSRWGGLSGGQTCAAGSEMGGGKWGGGSGGVPSLPASDGAAASAPTPAQPSCSAPSTAQLLTPRLPPDCPTPDPAPAPHSHYLTFLFLFSPYSLFGLTRLYDHPFIFKLSLPFCFRCFCLKIVLSRLPWQSSG